MQLIKNFVIILIICSFLSAFGEPPRISENRTELAKQYVSISFIKNNTTIDTAKGFFIGDNGYILMPRDLLLTSDKVKVSVTGDTQEYYVSNICYEDKESNLALVSVGYIPQNLYKKMEINLDNNNLADELYVISDFDKVTLQGVSINFFNTVNGFGSIFSHNHSGKERYSLTPLLNKYGQVVGLNYNYMLEVKHVAFCLHSQRLLATTKVEDSNYYIWQKKNRVPGNIDSSLYYLDAIYLYSKDNQNTDIPLRYLEKAVSLSPTEAGFHYQLANILLFEKNNTVNAAEHFNKCIELAPEYYGGYLGLAFCSLFNTTENNVTSALQYIDQAIGKSPTNYYIWYTKASVLVEGQEYEQAKAAYKKAIEIYPEYALAHNDLGILYSSLGQKEDARYEFEQAININPTYANPHYNLGLYYYQKGEFDAALAECQKSYTINPKDIDSLYQIGLCYSKMLDYDKGEEIFNKVIRLNPDYHNGYYSLGWIYSRKNNWPGAIKCYSKFLKFYPENVDAHSLLGSAYYELKEYPEAIKEVEKAIALDASDYTYFNQMGIIYEEMGQYTKAIPYLDKAVTMDPAISYAYFNLSKCYIKLKDKEKAIYNYKKFKELKPYDTQELDKLFKEYLGIPYNYPKE